MISIATERLIDNIFLENHKAVMLAFIKISFDIWLIINKLSYKNDSKHYIQSLE